MTSSVNGLRSPDNRGTLRLGSSFNVILSASEGPHRPAQASCEIPSRCSGQALRDARKAPLSPFAALRVNSANGLAAQDDNDDGERSTRCVAWERARTTSSERLDG